MLASFPVTSFFKQGLNILFKISSGAYALPHSVLHHQGAYAPYAGHASDFLNYTFSHIFNLYISLTNDWHFRNLQKNHHSLEKYLHKNNGKPKYCLTHVICTLLIII